RRCPVPIHQESTSWRDRRLRPADRRDRFSQRSPPGSWLLRVFPVAWLWSGRTPEVRVDQRRTREGGAEFSVFQAGVQKAVVFCPSGMPKTLFFGHSGVLVGGWHEVEAAAMEVDCGFEVGLVAETAGSILHPLNLRIDRFAGCIGDAMPKVSDD